MTRNDFARTLALVGALGVGVMAAVAWTQQEHPRTGEHDRGHERGHAGQEHARPDGPPGGNPLGAFPDLIGGLKASKGCLGVEAAQTMSGKNVIFAWFADKKAALRWYYSDMHQDVMTRFFPASGRKPLAGVPDDIGPIMAIASVTFADEPAFEETQLPISQIAIELYTPITGGLYLGSRFAPEGVRVKGMKDYTPGRASNEGGN
jgi:hypothetical protein